MGKRLDQLNLGLSNTMKVFAKKGFKKLNVFKPGIVETYDPKTRLADVKLLIQKTNDLQNAVPEDESILSNVLILFPKVGNTYVKFPIKKGDGVGVVFCDSSIDSWLAASFGITVNPQDTRAHSLSDAVAILGMYPPSLEEPDDDNTYIKLGVTDKDNNIQSEVKVNPDTGEITIATNGQTVIRLGSDSASDPIALGTATRAITGQIVDSIVTDLATFMGVMKTTNGGTLDAASITAYTNLVATTLSQAWADHGSKIKSTKVLGE